MNRQNAFTIKVNEDCSEELVAYIATLLEDGKVETVMKTVGSTSEVDRKTLQPDYKVVQVVWFKSPIPKELFKYEEEFEVIHNGATGLYYNGKPVTMNSYRVFVEDLTNENGGYYKYIPYDEMTNTAPIIDDREL